MRQKSLLLFSAFFLTAVSGVSAADGITVAPAAGSDITAAVADAKGSSEAVGTITINLAKGASYTVSGSLEPAAGLVINGNGATIDASALETPFILMSTTPSVELLNDYYCVDAVTISGVTVNGLKNSIFYDNNTKYCVVDFKIENSTLALATTAVENEALVSFKAGGAKDVTIKNSVIYGNGEVAKYFIRYNNSARLDRYGFDKNTEFQTMTYLDNTFYNLLKSDGQWGNYSAIAGQNYIKFDVQKNIWFDCGKDIIRRMAGGRFGNNAPKLFNLNTYFNDGECLAESEKTYDNGRILETNPEFKDAANADFTIGAYTQQAQFQTGAEKFLTKFEPADISAVKAELLAEINKASGLAGTDTSEAAELLRASIAAAQSVYDTAYFDFEITRAIETLKTAEAEFEKSGIVDVVIENNAPVEYFNLQGVRVENPANGIFIRRQGSEVSKILVK